MAGASADETPNKRITGKAPTPSKETMRLHPYALKLPSPIKSGRELEDEDSEARFGMMKYVISELLKDTTHVPAVYSLLQRRLNIKSAELDCGSSEQFEKLSTVAATDLEWVVATVERFSDMTVADIVKTKSIDEASPRHLFTFMTQLPPQLKLPSTLKLKDVFLRFVCDLDHQNGTRLSNFKRKGGFKMDGRLDWTQGCYKLLFSKDKKLAKVQHTGGDEVDATRYPITTDWVLCDNVSDWGAYVQLRPLPKVPLHSLFNETKQGPYQGVNFSQKAGAERFAPLAEKHYITFQADLAKTNSGGENKQAVKDELKAFDSQKKSETLEQARAKLKEQMSAKRQKRTIRFDGNSTASRGARHALAIVFVGVNSRSRSVVLAMAIREASVDQSLRYDHVRNFLRPYSALLALYCRMRQAIANRGASRLRLAFRPTGAAAPYPDIFLQGT